jgi:NAD(P)-dependent dehydrogenase (short-subunit alcohol dehydrogenase family)
MPVALVTGANKGIGLEIARQLGKRGFSVYIGARNATLGEEAAAKLRSENLDARSLHIDLDQPPTSQAAARTIQNEFQHLDVLVNNAAIIDRADGPPGAVDPNVVRRVMETNFFGALAVTQAMLPLLRAAPAARIVNVSSGLGSLTLNADPARPFAAFQFLGYNTSKAALNMLTIQLADQLRDTTIKVNAVSPGSVATDMNPQGTLTTEEGASEPVRLALLPADGPTGGFFHSAGSYPW